MPEKNPSSVLGFYAGIFNFYDTANTLLTFGLDRAWRRRAAREALVSSPRSVLDVCCGTGALTRELRRLSKGPVRVTGLDFSAPMLSLAENASRGEDITFIKADADRLPFPDASFDVLTIALASRNLNAAGGLPRYFAEFRRVLKPGGSFVHLETSRPRSRLIGFFFRAYVRLSTAFVAALFPGGRTAYRFLASSMLSFHGPEKITELLLAAGFTKAESRPLMFGALALHQAVK